MFQMPNRLVPDLAICIPSYNRKSKLESLLKSILQNLSEEDPSWLEVIIILDGSLDSSERMLTEIATLFKCDFKYAWQENKGLATTRNELVKLATAANIWFLDDDMTITLAALSAHQNHVREVYPILCGPSHVDGNEGLRMFYDSRWQALAETGTIERPDSLSFANTSAPRTLLLDYPFDESFTRYGFEDYELGIRLLNDNVKIKFDILAEVIHTYDRGPFQMLHNIRDEGSNRVKLASMYKEEGAFALELESRGYQNQLIRMSERGFSRSLWVGAHLIRSLAVIIEIGRPPRVTGYAFRLTRLANDMALHSGIAREGGKAKVAQSV